MSAAAMTEAATTEAAATEAAPAVVPAAAPAAAPRRFIVIEGIIGAGKTTLAEALRSYADEHGLGPAVVVDEPIDLACLRAFYADPHRWAYTFQTHIYTRRIQTILSRLRENPEARLFILDRSPATDRVFMALQDLSEMERRIYEDWADTYSELLPFSLGEASCIYLKPGLEDCMERLHSRGRAGETETDAGALQDYQRRLGAMHDYFLLRKSEAPEGEPFLPPRAPYKKVFQLEGDMTTVDIRTVGGRNAVCSSLFRIMYE